MISASEKEDTFSFKEVRILVATRAEILLAKKEMTTCAATSPKATRSILPAEIQRSPGVMAAISLMVASIEASTDEFFSNLSSNLFQLKVDGS